jgi:hypothetical protein
MKVEGKEEIAAKEMLRWAVSNTVDVTVNGLPEWAKQGTCVFWTFAPQSLVAGRDARSTTQVWPR